MRTQPHQPSPTNTRSTRAISSAVRVCLSAALLTSAVSASSQVLVDPGLDSDSQALLGFTQPNLGRWMQENAVLVTGVQGDGAAPFAGDGMIRLAQTGGGATQVRQRLDVSAFAATIDAGLGTMNARAMLNPNVANVSASVQALAFDANQIQIADNRSNCFSPDGDVSTWEEFVATLTLPVGTRFVALRINVTNSTLPGGTFLYADEAQCNLFAVLDPQALTDPGLDSGSQALLGFTQPNLDRWMQENAVLVTGAQSDGAAPFAGDGMLRIAQAGASATQVRQRLDVSAFAAAIDAGLGAMDARAMLNPNIANVSLNVQALAFDANQIQIDAITSNCHSPDGDVSTWEEFVATLTLPVGTRFVALRINVTNSTLPGGAFVYADEATVTIKASPVCFTDVGSALAGTFGDPQLSGQVSLGPGAVGNLLLSNALQNTPTALFVSVGPAGAGVPFKGGTLVPVPWLLLLTGLNTDTAGEIGIPLNFGLGIGGFALVFQYGILDGAAINGVSLSNALQLDLL